jgi:hypothetical protein
MSSTSKNFVMSRIGSTNHISMTITPQGATNRNVTWRSGHPKVVTVNQNGFATAVGFGRAFITVTTEDGGHFDSCIAMVGSDFTPASVEPFPRVKNDDGFAGWYHPGTSRIGITYRIPRFMQWNAGPCFGYCVMMGDHYCRFRNINVNEFFDNRSNVSYGNESPYLIGNFGEYINGSMQNSSSNFDDLKIILKRELVLGKPVIVSGNDGTWNHFALVAGYARGGNNPNDFIVIDPLESVPFSVLYTYEDFRRDFPNDAVTNNNTRPIYLFTDMNYEL